MYFLIGVVILIVFLVIVYFYFRIRIRHILDKAGFLGMNLKQVIDEARLEDQEVPKSLSSMDSIYLEQFRHDFPNFHIDELKRDAEKILLDSFNAIERHDSSKFKGKVKGFIDSMIDDNLGKEVHYEDFKIHNTVISNYRKEAGVATIFFATSFQYYKVCNGKSVKTQDRCKMEYIYVYDIHKAESDQKSLAIHCPNCGAPITSLGQKGCSYCGQAILEIIGRVFTCYDIVRY